MLKAEWEKQEAILLAFPHKNSDWRAYIHEARQNFIRILAEIIKIQKAIVCVDLDDTEGLELLCRAFGDKKSKSFAKEGERLVLGNLILVCIRCNDTWARDFGPISIQQDDRIVMLNFGFNGWGLKFASNYDNQINAKLQLFGILGSMQDRDLILEGGSIESDGNGVLLTTTQCLCEKNRNPHLSQSEIEAKLKQYLGVQKVLWLDHGYLAGDDTDSHIDTLARFINPSTIAYVSCEDKNDEHYLALKQMKEQLESFRDLNQQPYRLIPLPLPDIRESVFSQDPRDEAHRLPASYANFLILNEKTLLLPTYNVPDLDSQAIRALERFYRVIPIDCSTLIRQHGSLHCVSMQLYEIG